MSTRAYPNNLPSVYAGQKLAKLQGWARGDFGRYLAAFWPRHFPAMPLSPAYGFASNGDLDENTGCHASFVAIGAFGIPAGPCAMTPPNTSTAAQNTWLRLHNDPRVRALLNRDACMTGNCFTVARGGIPDQTAIGVVMLADDLADINRRIGALAGRQPSPWTAATTFWAWSGGGAPAASSILRMAPPGLADVPESVRFYALGDAIAQAAVAGTLPSTQAGTYANPAHGWIRTAQKMAAGRAVAASLGEDPGWYGVDPAARLMRWIEDANARAAVGSPASGAGPRPGGSFSGGGDNAAAVGVAVGLGAAGVGLVLLALRRRRG